MRAEPGEPQKKPISVPVRRWEKVPPPPMGEKTDEAWLVLCHPWDRPALWAYHQLKSVGFQRLHLVSADALMTAPHWEHRVTQAGAFFKVSLADGRVFSSESVRGVLNRVVNVSSRLLDQSAPHDRLYAEQEMTAFTLSWMSALGGPVLNPPTPQGLCGRWRSLLEWLVIAGEAGIPVPHFRASSCLPPGPDGVAGRLEVNPPIETVFVVGNSVVGRPMSESLIEACVQLASLSVTPLLGISFGRNPDGQVVFAGATPMPDLTEGGPPLIHALCRALGASTESEL